MNEDEKTCPKCAETVKAAAVVCKHCGYNFETSGGPESPVAPAPPKAGMGKGTKGCLLVAGVVVGLGVLGALAGGDGQSGNSNQVTSAAAGVTEAAKGDGVSSQQGANPKADSLTFTQRNAARSAQQYIGMSGFSRAGLINQLSSDAGEGYSKADATVAVDSLNVDWNEQAARSAKQYLSMSGFSCKNLIRQLSSSAGERFTVSEATYGAKQAGAC